MPRLRVIVLDSPADGLWRYALWADVPATRQAFYASTSKVSQWNGALPGDNAAIQSGTVTETVGYFNSASSSVLGDAQSKAQADWTAFQAFVTGHNRWSRYGSNWDGATWVSTGAA